MPVTNKGLIIGIPYQKWNNPGGDDCNLLLGGVDPKYRAAAFRDGIGNKVNLRDQGISTAAAAFLGGN